MAQWVFVEQQLGEKKNQNLSLSKTFSPPSLSFYNLELL